MIRSIISGLERDAWLNGLHRWLIASDAAPVIGDVDSLVPRATKGPPFWLTDEGFDRTFERASAPQLVIVHFRRSKMHTPVLFETAQGRPTIALGNGFSWKAEDPVDDPFHELMRVARTTLQQRTLRWSV